MKLNMEPHNKAGKLITFCGLDGCGKTTQIHNLQRYLKDFNRKVFLTKQPTDFVRNSDIFRAYMDTPTHDEFDYRSLSLLAASDRVQHSNREIMEHLSQGEIVISDRYFYSCLANLRSRGYMDDKWIYEIAESIPKPDIAFFLDIDVEIAIRRVRNRIEEKNRYIDIDLQYKLRNEYKDIAHENEGIIIATNISESATFEAIIDKINNILEE